MKEVETLGEVPREEEHTKAVKNLQDRNLICTREEESLFLMYLFFFLHPCWFLSQSNKTFTAILSHQYPLISLSSTF